MRSLNTVVILLSVVSVLIEGLQNTSTCGRRLAAHNPLLINQSPTNQWPWHAAIYHLNNEQPEYECGGTLINSNLVLTAAHCITRSDKPLDNSKVSVSLGRLNLDKNESSAQNFEVIFF